MGFKYNMGKVRLNTLWFGTVSGVLIPAMFFILIYLVRGSHLELSTFLREFYIIKALPKLISLCLLPDMIIFFIFMRLEYLRAARGVILSLFIYAVVILALKFG
jgi:hypothetical protein